MTAEVRSWLKLAESDWTAANRLTGGGTDAALCFHVQQCVEKLLKGCLVARQIRPPFTHDLIELSNRLAAADPAWTWNREELRFLTRAAVEMRYALEESTGLQDEAKLALDVGARIRVALLPFFPPPSP